MLIRKPVSTERVPKPYVKTKQGFQKNPEHKRFLETHEKFHGVFYENKEIGGHKPFKALAPLK